MKNKSIFSCFLAVFFMMVCFPKYQLLAANSNVERSNIPVENGYFYAYADGDNFVVSDFQTIDDSKTVTGTVKDSSGVPLQGVTVYVKSKPKSGTVTDNNGNFVLKVSDTATLVFTMTGYTKQEVNVRGHNAFNITLHAESSQLGEVVVVAFGTERKHEMVGSVATIKPSDLKIPSSNLTAALAGKAAGLIAFQRSGEPGADNANFFVRGVTTFGYRVNPLILIDGVESTVDDLARMKVDDIASFSILKDATATAVYGSRAANGIILIKTKEGKVGSANLSLRIENASSEPTKNIELADPVTYMEMANTAISTRDPLGAQLYSKQKIDQTVPGVNSIAYPANDWRKLLFKDRTMNQRLNLSISGGGGVARYYASGSYSKDNGLLKNDSRNNFSNNIQINNYSLRSNVSINVTRSTELTIRLNGYFEDYTGPLTGGAAMYNEVMHSNPVLFPAYYPYQEKYKYINHIMFGNYESTPGQLYQNPYADMMKGHRDASQSRMLAQFEVRQDLDFLTDGLTWSAMVNTDRHSYFAVERSYTPYYYQLDYYDRNGGDYILHNINPETGTEYLSYQPGDKNVNTSFYLQSDLNYSHKVGKSDISAFMVLMMQQNLVSNANDLLSSLPSRNLGISGKFSYSYDNRYYTEFNFGLNGSERFDKDHRYGFFPSLGVAWTVSNENFFASLKDKITNLRLRATYGIIGNDAIGSPEDRFFYLSNVDMNDANKAMRFGTDLQDGANGVSILRYANPSVTWEKAEKVNFAFELGLANHLSLDAEVYHQLRKDILMNRADIPESYGFAAPIAANVGVATARGVDVSLNYERYLNNSFWFKMTGNFTYATSKYKVFEEPHYKDTYRLHVGTPINQGWGLIAEHLFIDENEVANSPEQNYGPYGEGDIKYLDVNRDGRITDADIVPIGYPLVPEIVYGFGFSMGYKNFDFSAFFQGMANESFWIDAASTSPFNNQTQVLKAYADSYWNEDNRDIYALWPRLSPKVIDNNVQRSTWFMRDGAFLRVKQVELGYELPNGFKKSIHASAFRVYVNVMNPISFSKFNLWDVEMGGNGLGYPIQRIYNVGVSVNFR